MYLQRKLIRALLATLLMCVASSVHAYELEVRPVVDGIYALVGETEARTETNHGLNNTLGFIDTGSSIILISSGTNADAYDTIIRAIRSISDKPVRYVFNIGTQDHHWMGNHYFIAGGAEVIALKKTVDGQKANIDTQLTRLQQGIGQQAQSVKPVYASRIIDADRHALTIDGMQLELIWPGKGHYAGDAVLWLPGSRVMFSGDLVYMERMLAIHPTSDAAAWQQSFHVIADMQPQHIVPGHGGPADLAGAKRDTGNYLDWLTANVRAAIKDWKEIDETINALSDAPQFMHLKHYESWHRRNIHQTYLQFEGN